MILTGIDCVDPNGVHSESLQIHDIGLPKILEFVSKKVDRVAEVARAIARSQIGGERLVFSDVLPFGCCLQSLIRRQRISFG